MKCPYCGFSQDRVVDSRESKDADSIRRRRECEGCNKRFTTYERIDEIPYMVVKKDGRREKFDRQKVLSGLLHACEKRPVAAVKLEQIVDETEAYVVDSPERERSTSEVGELIMSRLEAAGAATGVAFEWHRYDAGADAFEKTGEYIPKALYDSIEENRVALKGPVTTPIGEGFASINVTLRQKFELFANFRPVKNLPGLKTRYPGLDIITVRENMEDLYAGL